MFAFPFFNNKQKSNNKVNVIRNIFQQQGFEFHNNIQSYQLNIFAVRVVSEVTDQFDDDIFCVYKTPAGNWIIKQWACTTDPGKYWLQHFKNPTGVAILAPGQYKNAYSLDYHQGKYLAFCQRLGPVNVYRDNDRDENYDFHDSSVQSGFFGMNVHRSNPYTESFIVDKWSAGCIVFKKVTDFDEFISLCIMSKKTFGNQFNFTLFTYEQFKEYYEVQ